MCNDSAVAPASMWAATSCCPGHACLPAAVAPRSVRAPWRWSASEGKAAGSTFGLELDVKAQGRWAAFSRSAPPPGAGVLDKRLLKAAQCVAAPVHFLELTVLSQEDLAELEDTGRKLACLELYSVLAGVPCTLKGELISAALHVTQAARSLGAVVGMAVGDALGAPFEFLDAVDQPLTQGPRCDLQTFCAIGVPRNKFKLKPGQWTDDTAMGLCLLDSLLACGGYNGSDARVRFHNWWFRGYNNAFGNDDRIGSVGLGGNVAKSLRAMEAGEVPPPTYEAETEDAGNGSLMRLAPVPIYYALDSVRAARLSAASSKATHPGQIAAAACALHGFLIAKAITRDEEQLTAAAFLDRTVKEFAALGFPGAEGCREVHRLVQSAEPAGREECWNWRTPQLPIERSLRARGGVYNGYPCKAGYFGSYCVDGLAIALWSFYHTRTFSEAVVRCVNFLGDADTTASICGQLAGAFYGYSSIDVRLLEVLEQWDNRDIACRAALLYASRPAP